MANNLEFFLLPAMSNASTGSKASILNILYFKNKYSKGMARNDVI